MGTYRCKSCGVGRGSSWRDLKEARCARTSDRGGTSCCTLLLYVWVFGVVGGWSGLVIGLDIANHNQAVSNISRNAPSNIHEPTRTHTTVLSSYLVRQLLALPEQDLLHDLREGIEDGLPHGLLYVQVDVCVDTRGGKKWWWGSEVIRSVIYAKVCMTTS